MPTYRLYLLLLIIIGRSESQVFGCVCGVSESSGLDFCDNEVEISNRISGGKVAEVNEFPWAALLEIKAGGNPLRCGGTLVNDRFVLTAAHCVSAPSSMQITVILGEHDTTRRLESTTLRVRAKPYRFNKHWSYKFDQEKGAWYDFALIELSTPVDFNRYPHIRPVCLPDRAEIDYIDQIATVSGWGLQNVDYKKYAKEGIIKGVGYGRAKILKKLDVKLVSQAKCRNIYRQVAEDIKLKESNLCAVSLTGDSCQGDSGGGLVAPRCDGKFYELIGVVSFGIGCNSTVNGVKIPGVYGRVSIVVDWIKHLTSEGTFCRKPTDPPLKIQTSHQKTTTSTTPRSNEKSTVPEWGQWTSFSACDKSCGIGKKKRDRFCIRNCKHTQQTQERICRIKEC